MFLLLGSNGKWSQNHQRILTELGVEYEAKDIEAMATPPDELVQRYKGVFVVTDTIAHFPYTLACLKNNIPIFCEKPVCVTREQLNAYKEYDKSRIFMSGHQLVFLDVVNRFSGGTANYFNSMRSGAIPRTEGAILSLAVHDIAVALEVLGWFESEIKVQVNSTSDKHEAKIYLSQTDGERVEFGNNEKLAEIYVASRSQQRLRHMTILNSNVALTLSPDNWKLPDLVKMELMYFLKCVEDEATPEKNNLTKTCKVMDVCFDIMDKLL